MVETALLVIDVQLAIVKGAFRESETLAAIAKLIERARAAGAPVLYLQHCEDHYPPLSKGGEGWPIHPAVAPTPAEVVIEKRASDGFYRTRLREELERLGARRLAICGLQTELCVDATARAALSQGFDVILAADAHTTEEGKTPASVVIAHHNRALGNLAHPDHRIAVEPSAAIAFA
jgi:nicotinamidase-related amidase